MKVGPVVVAALLLTGCGSEASVSATASPSQTRTSGASSTMTARGIAALGPTPGSVSYMNAVTAEDEAMVPLVTAVSQNCNETTSQAVCRRSISAMRAQVQAFQQELAGVRPPGCLADYDRKLREALNDFEQGDALGIKGIDESNPAEVGQGAGLVSAGGKAFPATADLEQAVGRCLQTGG